MRELGDARQEDETQVRVAGFERAIKISHDVAEDRQVLFFVHHIEQGRIVFIDEHHYLTACLFVSPLNQSLQTLVDFDVPFTAPVKGFISQQFLLQFQNQAFLVHVLGRAHIEMQDGIFRPLRFQPLQSQTLKQFSTPFKIGFQSTCQQRLAETARTAQEYVI